MVNRRIARSARLKHKKKDKAKKQSASESKHSVRESRSSGFGASKEEEAGPGSLVGKRNKVLFRSKGLVHPRSGSANDSQALILRQLQKEKSVMLKRQAEERMVLKERLRELTAQKQRLQRGENVKVERRELGKYIRQLREQLLLRHAEELSGWEQRMKDVQQQGNRHPNGKRVWLPSGIPASLYKHHQTAEAIEDAEEGWYDEAEEAVDEDLMVDEVVQMFSHLTA